MLMFQREVAERIVAPPGSKAYGRLSVLASWRTEAKILFDIAPSAFVPPPKVTSSVVGSCRAAQPLPCDATALQRVTEAAFGQRRKMLRQSLKSLGVDPARCLRGRNRADRARRGNPGGGLRQAARNIIRGYAADFSEVGQQALCSFYEFRAAAPFGPLRGEDGSQIRETTGRDRG